MNELGFNQVQMDLIKSISSAVNKSRLGIVNNYVNKSPGRVSLIKDSYQLIPTKEEMENEGNIIGSDPVE